MFNIEKPDDVRLRKMETNQIVDLVKISPKDNLKKFCIMPRKFCNESLEKIKSMEIFDDDIWVITFPKCGTTWTQEMVWMIGHDLDYETSLNTRLDDRFPFLEMSGFAENFPIDTFEICKNMPRPRYIKSHLPIFLLPDQLWTVKPNIIYVTRNAKDTVVSWYHHYSNMNGYQGTKEDFIDAFVNDFMFYSPMNNHTADFWELKDNKNISFLFFEDMKKNLDKEVKKMAKFMGKNYSQDDINKLCSHLSFESVKNNKMVNKEDTVKRIMEVRGKSYDPQKFSFIRKGEVGGYKEELTEEQNQMMDDYVKRGNAEIKFKL